MSKTIDYSFFEDMATNSYQWPNEHSVVKKVVKLHDVDPITTFSAQVTTLTSQIAALTTQERLLKVETIAAGNMPYSKVEMDNE